MAPPSHRGFSTPEGQQALQQYLAHEVDRRGMSWNSLSREIAGQASVATLRSYVHRGVAARPQRTTLAAIDRLLGWQPGSARLVLKGGDPVIQTVGTEHPGRLDNTGPPPALSGEKWERLSPVQQRAVLTVIDSMLEEGADEPGPDA